MNLAQPDPAKNLPEAIFKQAVLMEEQGHKTYWVGEGLARAIDGKPPSGFSLVTSASPEQIISLLPSAVPTRSGGRSFLVPSAEGPFDLTPLGPDESIDENLNRRGFRLLAMAWRPSLDEWTDPYSGRENLSERSLRCVRSAPKDLAQAPVRVLQAARLTAHLGLRVDPSLEAAMGEAYRAGSRQVPTCHLRGELSRLILCEDPSPGIELLRVTGVDRQLGVGGREDAGRLMALMPLDLGLRWAIWMRNASGTRPLRKLRVDVDTTLRVQRLSASHPIEERSPRRRGRTLRKFFEQIGPEDFQKLIRLRTEELREVPGEEAEHSRIELESLTAAVAAESAQAEKEKKRIRPVLGGQDIMNALKMPPGPKVGIALAFLTDHVNAHPESNTAAELTKLLKEWAE